MQTNLKDSCNQTALSTTPLPVVPTIEEREIHNARIAPNTPWNTEASASPAPQARPSNYTTAAVNTRSQNQPKKREIATPTPINTNLPYNRRQCTLCKKFGHNVQTRTKRSETLNDINNHIQAILNTILDTGRVPNGWEDAGKEFFIATWIDQGSGMKEGYQEYI